MPETAAQCAERHRRGEEVALMRFDGLDDTRLMLLRPSRGGSGRTSVEAGKRAALEAYAHNNGLTMEQLERVRAAGAWRRGALITR